MILYLKSILRQDDEERMRDSLKILHLASERTWRGGENQMFLLTKSAPTLAPCEFHIATPEDSEAFRRLASHARLVPTSFGPFGMLPSAKHLAWYIRQNGIDILDAQSSKGHSLGLLVKRFAPEVKLIVHRRVDNVPSGGFFNRRKYLSPRVDRYVAISRAIASVLTDYGVPGERVSVVRSAVTATTPSPAERAAARAAVVAEFGFDSTRPIIAMVGYMTPQKGHEVLIEALGILKSKGIATQTFCAGDGPLRPGVEAAARSLGVDGDVRFLGVRSDVPRLLAASDILAMPSNFEGLGTTILDALHAGCAVAASAVGGIPEMIIPDETGLLSPVKDARTFAYNLERLLNDAALRVRLNEAGRRLAEREFSLEQMVRGNIQVYRDVLGQT